MFLGSNGVSSIGSDVTVTVLLAALTIAAIAACIVLLCRYSGKELPHKRWVLAVIFAAGVALRLVFGLCIRGYRADYRVFTDMFDHLSKNGVGSYYKGDPDIVLYPVTYFIYLIFGGFSNITGLSDFAVGTQFMVKLPMIIADILAAYGVYKIACRYFDRGVGYVLCGFVCCCPMFFLGSAIWATQTVFVAVFLVYAFYFLARKRYAAAIAFATAAAFSGKEGIYVFPVFLVFSLFHFVRAVMRIKKEGLRGKAIVGECSAAYSVPAAFVLSFVAAWLLGLFMTASYTYDPFVYLYEFLIKPFGSWEIFTYNGLSVYTIFGQNGVDRAMRFPVWVMFGVFLAVILALVCVVYFSKRNRATMVLLAAYSMFTVPIYYPGSTAIGLQPAFIAMIAAYALVRDKRILYVAFLSGLMYVVNATSVLAEAGYLNNLADHYFTGAGYTGSTLLEGGLSAIPIACSAITVLSHLYFTYVTISIGMTGQKKMLGNASGIPACLKEFFARKRAE